MSLAGIAATSFFSGAFAPSGPAKLEQARQEFQQLGQDLQTGNLARAQTDFKNLRQDAGSVTHHHYSYLHANGETGQNSITRVLDQLGQALQVGNLSTAKQSYASLVEDFQQLNPGTGPDGGYVPVPGFVNISA